MKCPICKGKNYHRVENRRRYRRFFCNDCEHTDVYLPYGNKEIN